MIFNLKNRYFNKNIQKKIIKREKELNNKLNDELKFKINMNYFHIISL